MNDTDDNVPLGPDTPHISMGEACRRLSVSRSTIQRMIDGGVLKAMRTMGGHRRILIESLESFSEKRKSSPKGWTRTPEIHSEGLTKRIDDDPIDIYSEIANI